MRNQLLNLALALAFVTCFGLSTVGLAQAQPPSLGVFFDAAGTQSGRAGVVAFAPFTFYVVGSHLTGMTGYEFGLALPANLLYTTPTQLHPAAGICSGCNGTNFIVALTSCVLDPGPVPLMSVTALFLAQPPNDTVLGLTGSSPSSTPGGEPGYTDCSAVHQTFVHTSGPRGDGSAVVNPFDPCPGIPDESYYHIAAPIVNAAAGQLVAIPISAFSEYIFNGATQAKCTYVPPPFVEVSFGLEWSPAVASFDHAALLPAGSGFTLTATPAGPGRVDVLLQSVGVPQPPETATAWVEIALHTLGENTSTPLTIADLEMLAIRVEGEIPSPQPSVPHAGSLTVGAVPNGADSWGALKASFGDDR